MHRRQSRVRDTGSSLNICLNVVDEMVFFLIISLRMYIVHWIKFMCYFLDCFCLYVCFRGNMYLLVSCKVLICYENVFYLPLLLLAVVVVTKLWKCA